MCREQVRMGSPTHSQQPRRAAPDRTTVPNIANDARFHAAFESNAPTGQTLMVLPGCSCREVAALFDPTWDLGTGEPRSAAASGVL
jgi:hypothetical protein